MARLRDRLRRAWEGFRYPDRVAFLEASLESITQVADRAHAQLWEYERDEREFVKIQIERVNAPYLGDG